MKLAININPKDLALFIYQIRTGTHFEDTSLFYDILYSIKSDILINVLFSNGVNLRTSKDLKDNVKLTDIDNIFKTNKLYKKYVIDK